MTHRVQAESISAPLYEVRAASTAAGGTALSTTAGLITIPMGADWLSLTPRNLVGATVARVALNPRLTIIKTANLLASEGTDLSAEAQDGDTTAMAFGGFNTLANGDAQYVGSHVPFRGVLVDVGTVNAVPGTLTVDYWDGSSAWVDTSATDNTDTGAPFAQDGTVVGTVPAGWTRSSLRTNGAVTAGAAVFDAFVSRAPYINNLYWTRWTTSAAHTDPSTILQLRSLNRSTAYLELLSGQTYEQKLVNDAIAAVEALTDAGTANLIVNVGVAWGEVFA